MEIQTQAFIKSFNEAFAAKDVAFIADSVTGDVIWKMAGETVITGKQAVIDALENMDDGNSYELTLDSIIIHGTSASANGIMKSVSTSGKAQAYEFCDVYELNEPEGGKIKKMTSYVVEAAAVQHD